MICTGGQGVTTWEQRHPFWKWEVVCCRGRGSPRTWSVPGTPAHCVLHQSQGKGALQTLCHSWSHTSVAPWRPHLNPYLQFSSVAQLCPTLCNPMNRSTPGLPVHHQLQEFTQTCAHRVGDAIQPSHPLSSPSPPAPNPSQHQGLFQ